MLMPCDGAAGLGDAVDPDGSPDGARVREHTSAPCRSCATSLCFGSGNLVSNHGGSLPSCLISLAVAMNVRAAGNLVLVDRKAPS